MKAKNIKYMVSFIITLLLLTAVSSFAYFVTAITGSETEATILAGSGSMEIYYENGSGIIASLSLMPSNTHFASKNFTITGNNKTSGIMNYTLNLVVTTNTFTDYAIGYKLTSTNTNSNGTVVPQTTNDMCYLLKGPETKVLGSGSFTGPTSGNKVHTYNIKLYFPETEYLQNDDNNKQIEAHIKTEEGIKTKDECKQLPGIRDIILANNGGEENITEAPSNLFENISGPTENMMYKMEDDYGTSYYFRGARDYVNNNLIFAQYQWKIIRINGDGSVRLQYNGMCTDNKCIIFGMSTPMLLEPNHSLFNKYGYSNYNTFQEDNKYFGYMYGGASGTPSTSRLNATSNETSSNIKLYLDAWYETNLSGTSYESYISDTIFCNDRQLESEVGGPSASGGYGKLNTYYATYHRLLTNKTPTLKCAQTNDRFTTINYNNSSVPGNNALIYPVGLITADEAALSGAKVETHNPGALLNTGFTISPVSYRYLPALDNYNVIMYDNRLNENRFLGVYYETHGVININSNTPVTGSGTAQDPYIVR